MGSNGVGVGRAIGLLLGVAADGVGGEHKRGVPGPLSARGAAIALGVAADRLGKDRAALRVLGTALTTWGALGGAALAAQGTMLARQLESEDFDAARVGLAELDPRCTDSLGGVGLTRAAVEAVAGNTSSMVVAPLLWGAVAGTPGILAHTAVKHIKGTLARRSKRPRRLSVVIDRTDEFVDLLPTRCTSALTVAAAPVVGGSASESWLAWRRDSAAHPSPNAGRVEAAFAGALEIRLGGRTVYPDRIQELPVLGAGRNPDAGHVTRAVELSRLVGWLAAVSAAVLAVVFSGSRRRR